MESVSPIELRNNFYHVKYLRELAQNFLPIRRGLKPAKQHLDLKSRFILTPKELRKWKELFCVNREAVPFTIPVRAGSLALMRYINLHQLSFKNLFHVKSKLVVHPGGHRIRTGEYQTHFKCSHIIEGTKAIVTLYSETHCPNGKPLMTLTGWFVIRGLAARDKTRPVITSEFDGISRRLPAFSPNETAIQKSRIHIPQSMGLAYGRLSGDLNPVHTTRIGAYAIGKSKPFIQGFCTLNLIISELAKKFSVPIDQLELTYCNPIYVNNHVDLCLNGRQIEVLDSNGRLLAFGRVS